MSDKKFVKDFIKWRSENGYPKRQECRDIFKNFKDADDELCKSQNEEGLKVLTSSSIGSRPFWIDYVMNQEKPSVFLDNLFKRDSEVTKNDPKDSISTVTKPSDEEIKDIIIDCTYEYIRANKTVPQFRELNTGYRINKYFASEKELFEGVKQKYDLSEYVLNESIFTDEYNKYVINEVKKYKRFIVTTAVVNKKVNKQFLNSIKNYCERKDALCLIMPCQDTFARNTGFQYQLDTELKDFPIVYKDLYLNNNIYLSNIRVSAKMINPNMGLGQLSVDSSVIIGNPKQDLTFISNAFEKTPRAVMSTGAITLPDYSNDLYLSDRINRISEIAHIQGCLIVEIQDDKIFHFRQVQAGPNGEIVDLGIQYNADKSISISDEPLLVCGDAHFTELNDKVFEKNKELIKELNIHDLVLHDIISCGSISHHNEKKNISKAILVQDSTISLQDEADKCAEKIIELLACISGDIYIVYSNHHSHIMRYLEEGRYIKDAINKRLALELAMNAIDGFDAFEYLMRAKTDLQYLSDEDFNRIKFLKKLENKEIYGCTISNHGDKGGNGSRGNLQTYFKAFPKSISGHTHVASIYKSAYSVGTMSILDPTYVSGLSSWTHTSCITYKNGERQLISFVKNNDGEYTWKI